MEHIELTEKMEHIEQTGFELLVFSLSFLKYLILYKKTNFILNQHVVPEEM